MKRLIAVLFLTVLFLPLNLYAQSGRKTTEQKPDKGQASKPAETSDGITDRIASPEGETIEGDVIRFDTALVTVPVTVQDRYGRYVPVLRRENFRIMEDGVEQKIAYFATSDSPFSVVLVLDTSGSTRLRLDDIDSLFGIAQAFTWIAEELGRQYSIGYYPSKPGQNGERRQIKVSVTEADLVVKARDSYIYSDKGHKLTQMNSRMSP